MYRRSYLIWSPELEQRVIAHHRRGHRPTRPTAVSPPCAWHASSGGSYDLVFRRPRAYSHLCAAAHAPLGHPGLPSYSSLPPGNRAHPTYARTCILVDRLERLHPVVVTQQLEVSSTESVAADGSVAHPRDTLLPEGPGIGAVSVVYFGPLPGTPRGTTQNLAFFPLIVAAAEPTSSMTRLPSTTNTASIPEPS